MAMRKEQLFDSEYGDDGYADIFPTKRILIDALLITQTNGGVQVAYRDTSDLVKFLREAKAVPVDDCAAEIYQPVPPELVMAVIPLGSYEKKALGVGN
jgi:hypothetical protein